jgi:hypothetical protein
MGPEPQGDRTGETAQRFFLARGGIGLGSSLLTGNTSLIEPSIRSGGE